MSFGGPSKVMKVSLIITGIFALAVRAAKG